jgi:hypothetical protein
MNLNEYLEKAANSYLGKNPNQFVKANGPQSVTAQKRAPADTWTKVNLTGGEEVRPVSAYLGKKGDLIFKCFLKSPMNNVRHIEIMSKNCNDLFEGMEKIQAEIAAIASQFQKKGDVERMTADAVNQSDPLFGSWA